MSGARDGNCSSDSDKSLSARHQGLGLEWPISCAKPDVTNKRGGLCNAHCAHASHDSPPQFTQLPILPVIQFAISHCLTHFSEIKLITRHARVASRTHVRARRVSHLHTWIATRYAIDKLPWNHA